MLVLSKKRVENGTTIVVMTAWSYADSRGVFSLVKLEHFGLKFSRTAPDGLYILLELGKIVHHFHEKTPSIQ